MPDVPTAPLTVVGLVLRDSDGRLWLRDASGIHLLSRNKVQPRGAAIEARKLEREGVAP